VISDQQIEELATDKIVSKLPKALFFIDGIDIQDLQYHHYMAMVVNH